MRQRLIPAKSDWFHLETHHSWDSGAPIQTVPPDIDALDLLAPIESGGRQFFPLVRNTLALKCGLQITFLRKEPPGRVYQGGDIDNRLKTLFDALAIPKPEQIVNDHSIPDPIFCLLEDDGLISRIEVDSRQLLSRPNASKHEVHLVIEVDVRVTNPRTYNHVFLGD